ncbi:hypothetical protein GCM10010387_58000 [Streptomyces inusitatus]|uniref:Uncharacterized protein n=1 Tax=Streptomyces inusitatus TaxID=68221 RepID=A0A918QKC4_9ACTN|nr:hypothetical protein [Streptomyces inusitatus]GGZ56392.1 hypothetical protein GCM10010387_58000 [Streptomyces inusitatus]
MRIALWLTFAASVVANVYVNNFAGLEGIAHGGALAGVAVVLVGSVVGLWRTKEKRDA